MGALAGLGTAVDAVVATDLPALSLEQLMQAYALGSPQTQRLQGFGSAVLAELHSRGGGQLPTDDGGLRSLAGWAAQASGDSPSSAGRLLQLATALEQGLPAVAQAVLDGAVGFKQAQVLTRLVGKINPSALLEAQPDLIVAARLMNPEELGAYVQHQLATWVEPVLDDAEADASNRRFLKTRTEPDGSLWGSFRLAAGDGEGLLTALEPLARKQGKQDTRSAAQRRADALTDIIEQVLRHGDLPDAGGQRPNLAYVLPADWAARQAAEHNCADCRRCPQHQPATFADLIAAGIPSARPSTATDSGTATDTGTEPDSSGPDGRRPVVPAEHACAVAAWTGPQTRARIETILCDARITRVLLSPLGQVTGLESLSDSITPAQRRALAARDLGCAVRGCTRPPAMCDAHHLTRRADGGETTLRNLVLLCRRHHVLWHLGKITLEQLHAPWLTDPWLTDPYPDEPPPAAERIRRFDKALGIS